MSSYLLEHPLSSSSEFPKDFTYDLLLENLTKLFERIQKEEKEFLTLEENSKKKIEIKYSDLSGTLISFSIPAYYTIREIQEELLKTIPSDLQSHLQIGSISLEITDSKERIYKVQPLVSSSTIQNQLVIDYDTSKIGLGIFGKICFRIQSTIPFLQSLKSITLFVHGNMKIKELKEEVKRRFSILYNSSNSFIYEFPEEEKGKYYDSEEQTINGTNLWSQTLICSISMNNSTASSFSSSSSQVCLFVKTLTGKTITLIVDSLSITVGEFKTKIEQKEKISPNEQRLIFGGREIVDEKCLSDYKIQRESTIHMVTQSRGGMYVLQSSRNGFDVISISSTTALESINKLLKLNEFQSKLSSLKEVNKELAFEIVLEMKRTYLKLKELVEREEIVGENSQTKEKWIKEEK